MLVFAFDATTVGCVVDVVAVVGVEVVDVAVAAEAPDVAAVGDVDVDVDFEAAVNVLDVLEVVVRAAAFAVVVAPPAWDARPANSPVPVMAPASDQRVSLVIRRSPASRFRRLLRLSRWRSMTTIVGAGPQRPLGRR